jgi:hypothetical protein
MSCCRSVRLICAGLMLWLASVSPASAAPKQVVLLYDERTDLPGVSALHASLPRRLTSGPPDSVEIYREEMDLSGSVRIRTSSACGLPSHEVRRQADRHGRGRHEPGA